MLKPISRISRKKAISAIIALSLMLVVVVVAFSVFKGWHTDFTSEINTAVGDEVPVESEIKDIGKNSLLVRNSGGNITVDSVKVGGKDCNISTSLTSGMSDVSLQNCTQGMKGVEDVVITTSSGVISKRMYVEGPEQVVGGTGVTALVDSFEHWPNGITDAVPANWTRVSNTTTERSSSYASYGNYSWYMSGTYMSGGTEAYRIINLTDYGTLQLDGHYGGGADLYIGDDQETSKSNMNQIVGDETFFPTGNFTTHHDVTNFSGMKKILFFVGGSAHGNELYLDRMKFSPVDFLIGGENPDFFTFPSKESVGLSTMVETGIYGITNATESQSVSISGDGSPQFRICADSNCNTVDHDWSSSGTIDEGQYLQLRLTSSNWYGITRSANLTIGEYSIQWVVTTADVEVDSFENWPNGTDDVPQGWEVVNLYNSDDVKRAINPSHKNYSMYIGGGYSGGGRVIQKFFNLTDIYEVSFDQTVNDSSIDHNLYFKVNGTTEKEYDTVGPRGTYTFQISSHSGVKDFEIEWFDGFGGYTNLDYLRLFPEPGFRINSSNPYNFGFETISDSQLNTEYISSIVEVSNFTGSFPISVLGHSSAEYRICADSNCNTVDHGWTNNEGTIQNSEYVQLRLNSASGYGLTRTANLSIGDYSTSWEVMTQKQNNHTVFVTSSQWDANLGGLSGGDNKCQNVASNAGLNGTYKAWLSTTSTDARDRMSSNVTGGLALFVNTNKDKVADNWSDFIDGTLDQAILYDENGSLRSQAVVWTGTYYNGTVAMSSCDDWTVNSGGGNAASIGYANRTNSSWSNTENFNFGTWACSNTHHLYCIEQ